MLAHFPFKYKAVALGAVGLLALGRLLRHGHNDNAPEKQAHEDAEIRKNQSESQIDKTLKDSFPASDPPAWY